MVGFHPGEFSSGSETLDLLIRGRGGHSAYPEETIDPVVLAAQTVIALQTIISRGRSPHEFAVLTVAQIHGGNKNNAIPDEVALQINIRYYAREVRDHLLAAILRVACGTAAAAGVPEDRMPVLSLHKDAVPPLRNDPSLTMRCIEACRNILGDAKVIDLQPLSGSEDFGIFGSVEPPIPLCYFRIGCDDPEVIRAAKQSGEKLPYLHSSRFAPLPEPTIKTGIIAMGAAVLGLLRK
jgi:hippurate hydrolase